MPVNKNTLAIAKMQKDLEHIKEGLVENKEDHKKIFKKIDQFIDTAEKRYASKWVENLLVWGGGIMGAIIIGSLMTLIIK